MQELVLDTKSAPAEDGAGPASSLALVGRHTWRGVLYLLAFLASAVLGMGVQQACRQLGAPRPLAGLLTLGVYAGAAWGSVALVRRRVERRPLAGLGLTWGAPSLRHLGAGAAVGLGMLGLVAGVALAGGWAQLSAPPAPWGPSALSAATGGLFLFTAVGFAEELVFRGALPSSLGERLPLWAATTVSGALFGLVHVVNAGFTPAVMVSAVAVTALLMLARLLTGSLWWAVGWHLAWDWGQFHLVGFTPAGAAGSPHALVSLALSGPGWLVGPAEFIEGGALVIAVELLGAAALLAWAHRSGRAPRWRQPLG